MTTRSTGWIAGVLAVGALAVIAAFAVHSAVSRPTTRAERAAQLEQQLRCPTCQAESVAASNAPIAQSMSSQVHRLLRLGRSDDQVRAWFVRRYGEDILLMPSGGGAGVALFVVPAVVLAGGAASAWWLTRRGRRARRDRAPGPALSRGRLAVAGGTCLAVGVVVPLALSMHSGGGQEARSTPTDTRPMTARAWEAVGESLDRQRQYRRAVDAYRHALRRGSDRPSLREQLGFDLLRTDRPAAAERVVRPALAGGRERAIAMLVLGLAQRAQGQEAGRATLRRFLRAFPDHPAAAQVRRLLTESGRGR